MPGSRAFMDVEVFCDNNSPRLKDEIIEGLKLRIKRLEFENQKLHDDNSAKNSSMHKLRAQQKGERQSQQIVTQEIVRTKRNLKEFEGIKDELESELTTNKSRLDTSEQQRKHLLRTIAKLKIDNEAFQKVISDQQKEIIHIHSIQDTLDTQTKHYEQEVYSLKSEINELNSHIVEEQQKRSELKDQTREKLEFVKSEQSVWRERIENHEHEVQQLNNQISTLQEDVSEAHSIANAAADALAKEESLNVKIRQEKESIMRELGERTAGYEELLQENDALRQIISNLRLKQRREDAQKRCEHIGELDKMIEASKFRRQQSRHRLVTIRSSPRAHLKNTTLEELYASGEYDPQKENIFFDNSGRFLNVEATFYSPPRQPPRMTPEGRLPSGEDEPEIGHGSGQQNGALPLRVNAEARLRTIDPTCPAGKAYETKVIDIGNNRRVVRANTPQRPWKPFR